MTVPNLRRGSIVRNPISGDEYEIDHALGEGGSGTAYAARRGRRRVCLKLTDDSLAWHREAYMGELLAGHPRVLAVHDTFPVVRRGNVFFAVAMDLADGTVADALDDGPWRERKVKTEIAGVLAALAKLQDSGAVHRDITPFNVFVTGPTGMLKLGDFGIARHSLSGKRRVFADRFNPTYVDPHVFTGRRKAWTVGDDLWQVGQLAAGLLRGDTWPIHISEVRDLDCSPELRLAIRRAIGAPAHRFPDARSMAAGLRAKHVLRFSRPTSLEGRNIVFTGPLSVNRVKATRAAGRAGAKVLTAPSTWMDVLVVGHDMRTWIAGEAGGIKILETLVLQERGYDVSMITGRHFERLVGLR